jgi:hypothetical protein
MDMAAVLPIVMGKKLPAIMDSTIKIFFMWMPSSP